VRSLIRCSARGHIIKRINIQSFSFSNPTFIVFTSHNAFKFNVNFFFYVFTITFHPHRSPQALLFLQNHLKTKPRISPQKTLSPAPLQFGFQKGPFFSLLLQHWRQGTLFFHSFYYLFIPMNLSS